MIVVGAATVVAAVGAFAAFRTPPWINQAAFDRIVIGASLEDAEEQVGLPPGDYSTGPLIADIPGHRGCEGPDRIMYRVDIMPDTIEKRWLGDFGVITVYVDNDGIVQDKDFIIARRKSGSFFDRLWRHLGL